MIKKLFILICSLFFISQLYLNHAMIIKNIIYIDWKFLDGYLSRNLIEEEPKLNQSSFRNPQISFNYSWINSDEFILISHRGGDYLTTGQNTKTTILNSLRSSSKFIEVDFILNDDDIVCMTDDLYKDDSCDIDWMIQQLLIYPFSLVIDLKLDVHNSNLFRKFYKKLINTKNFMLIKNKIIPQAYNLEHLIILNDLGLSTGPIFTTYRTNIPESIIFKYLSYFGIKAIALPLSEIGSVKYNKDENAAFFIYPIRSPDEFLTIKNFKIKGIYTSMSRTSLTN